MAARSSCCCSQSTAWLQACIEYGCCRQQASHPAKVWTQERTCQLPAQLLPYSCVLTSRSERFPHQVLIIFAPHTTITRRCLAAAPLASHEHNSRWQMLLSYSSIRTAKDSTKCCAGSTWQLAGAVAAVNQLPGFKLALSMAAADNKRLTLRKFGRKDQHASCQLSFYPTLVSSPHVQRDSHIKFRSSSPAHKHRQTKMSGVCNTPARKSSALAILLSTRGNQRDSHGMSNMAAGKVTAVNSPFSPMQPCPHFALCACIFFPAKKQNPSLETVCVWYSLNALHNFRAVPIETWRKVRFRRQGAGGLRICLQHLPSHGS